MDKGCIHVETSYPDIRRSLEDGFRFHMETAITRDLSIVVTKYLASGSRKSIVLLFPGPRWRSPSLSL